MAEDSPQPLIQLVTKYDKPTYPCGVRAGDRIRLRRSLAYQNADGTPTGVSRPRGSLATVLVGRSEEPNIVWLRWDDGEVQTWDETIRRAFSVARRGAG